MSTLVSLSADPILRFTDVNGNALVGGLLTTLVGGVNYPTYSESTGTVALPNPIVLNSRGEIATNSGISTPMYVVPNVAYTYILQDALLNTIWTASNIVCSATTATILAGLTQTVLGGILYPITPAESAVSITPVNLVYPPMYVDRYGTNTLPGITDMSAAFQSAINVAQAVIGAGQNGIPVRFLATAYRINAPPTIATSASVMVPLDIGGAGMGTVLYCGLTGTGGLISLTSGCYLHDMQVASVAGTTNTGVIVETTSGAQPISWRIERVYSRMQGIGFLLQNTNSGVIRDCWHWNDKAPALPIAISPRGININHGIYANGSFVNDVSIYDFMGGCDPVNYASGQRWIKNDATNSINFRIRGGLAVNESPGSSCQFLELGANAGSTHVIGAEAVGIYHESGFLQFNGMSFSNVYSCTNTVADISGVGIKFSNNSLANVIGANSQNGSMNFDTGSGANTISGGSYTGFVDIAVTPNNYLSGANRAAAAGGILLYSIPYSASMTPNCASGNYGTIVVTSATAFTMNNPLNPYPGARHSVKFKNTSGGAIGAITWGSAYRVSVSFVKPTNGNSSTLDFIYDTNTWVQDVSSGDVPN